MRLQGEVALVTGSTHGIGRAIATRFAREGASVVVTGRDREAGARVVDEITGDGGRAVMIAADLRDESAIEALVAGAVDRFGRVDIAVNNAAGTDLHRAGADRAVTELTVEGFDRVVAVNLRGPVLVAKHAIRAMLAAGGGSVVNITSLMALRGHPGVDAYTATKGALDALTRSIAVEYGPSNVRCNAIAVGLVAFTDERPDHRELRPIARPGSPLVDAHLTRLGTPDDVAHAAVYLASRAESGFVTGTVLVVDGGVSCRSPAPWSTAPPAGVTV